MWTDTTRTQYARAELTLPSDLTDAEWRVLEPFFPPPSHVGRPRKSPLRRIIEAILYLLRGGLPWRMLPPCFPPVSTVRRWFYLWRDSGLWLSLNHALLLIGREEVGREASDYSAAEPLMAISVAAPKALLADKGYDGDRFRESLLIRGILPIISPRSNRKVPEHPDYRRYRDRNRVEQMFGKLKQQRRIATRYDKTILSFESFLNLAAARLWLKSFVNTAQIACALIKFILEQRLPNNPRLSSIPGWRDNTGLQR